MKNVLTALFCLAAAAVTFGLVRRAFNEQAARPQVRVPVTTVPAPRSRGRRFDL